MIAELGVTADPEALVPGSPRAAWRDADDLEERGRELSEASERIRARTIEGWSGAAADEWETRQAGLSTACDAVADAYSIVAGALRRHGDVLAQAQRDARDAVELWDGRQVAGPGSRCRVDGAWSLNDAPEFLRGVPASPADRAEAVAILDAARAEVRASGSDLALLLQEFSVGLPDGRWHTGQFFKGVLDWALGVVSFAWRVSTLRAVVDIEGSRADNAQMVAGAVATWHEFERDPYNTTTLVLDAQTLKDDPALWWGRAAPDLALAAAPAGLAGFRWATRGVTLTDRVAGVGPSITEGTVAAPTTSPGYVVGPGGTAFVAEGKFDFLFGRAMSSEHNIARSRELAEQLARVGLYDTPMGREVLLAHFDEVVGTSDNVSRVLVDQYGYHEVRDSLLAGPLGFVKFESTWIRTESGLRLSTVVPYGRF